MLQWLQQNQQMNEVTEMIIKANKTIKYKYILKIRSQIQCEPNVNEMFWH